MHSVRRAPKSPRPQPFPQLSSHEGGRAAHRLGLAVDDVVTAYCQTLVEPAGQGSTQLAAAAYRLWRLAGTLVPTESGTAAPGCAHASRDTLRVQ